MSKFQFLGLLLLVAISCAASLPDPCVATSSTPDVKLAVTISDGRSSVQQGTCTPTAPQNLTVRENAPIERMKAISEEHGIQLETTK